MASRLVRTAPFRHWKTPTDDADGDGYTLYEEWYRNTDPHTADETVTYRVRESSDPEGVFAELEEYFDAGGSYTTDARYGENASGRFAYTTVNGVRQQDTLGRALDPVTLEYGDERF